MIRKYLPLLVFMAAALLYWTIRSHQRGAPKAPRNEDTTIETTIALNRQAHHILYSRHARCRMECRHIDESEVLEILKNGVLNTEKIRESEQGVSYPLEGVTHDNQRVRIVFAPKDADQLEVVTCIDLGTEWPCDCKWFYAIEHIMLISRPAIATFWAW